MTDDIQQEIRATREAFAKRHDYNLEAMVAELRMREQASARPIRPLPTNPSVVSPAPLDTDISRDQPPAAPNAESGGV